MVLVLSNKKDAYYYTTATKCSCLSATYGHGASCKHQRKFFSQGGELAAKENECIRPDMRGFQPFDLMPGEKAVRGA